MRRLVVFASLAAAALLAAGVGRAALAPAVCTHAAARAAVLASPALREIRETLRYGGGIDRLICHDFTADGATDMAATVFSGGTAGDTAWVVFRKVHQRWRLAHKVLDAYKVALMRVDDDFVETSPVYLKNDPNCCPTGGFDHSRYHWNGSRFRVVRSWHDDSPTP